MFEPSGHGTGRRHFTGVDGAGDDANARLLRRMLANHSAIREHGESFLTQEAIPTAGNPSTIERIGHAHCLS